MPTLRAHGAHDEQSMVLRFDTTASVDDVVARLLNAVRITDLSLLGVFGDGDRVFPVSGQIRTRVATDWHVELGWRTKPASAEWQIELFLRRAELMLELPAGVQLTVEPSRLCRADHGSTN